MSARRVTSRTLVWLCALVGLLALFDTPAQAEVTHKFLSQITEIPAEGPHKEAVPAPGPIGEAVGMTLDSGELYVAEGFQNSRLDKFDASSGAFVSQFAQVPPPVYDLRQSVAVGHATGDVYVVGDEQGTSGEPEGLVAVFDAAGGLQTVWKGADTPGTAFGCFECGPGRGGVAVDNSTSLGDWAAGDVYVADPTHAVVDVFKPEAGGKEEYVTQLTGPEPSLFSKPDSVAVDQSNGDVVVGDGEGVVDVFEPVAGMPKVYKLLFKITGTPAGGFGGVGSVAVDGGNGDIYVTEGNAFEGTVIDQFDSEGKYLGRLTRTPAGSFSHVGGVAVDPATHNVYVGDAAGVDLFGANIVIPDVTSEPATNAQPASATLNGVVNPAGVQVSDCHFDYGTTASYGQSVPCAQTPAQIGAGTSPVTVSADVSGLTPSVAYHFRLSASNVNGPNPGADRLLGPPLIDGESAAPAAQTTATLQAQVNPDGADTTYHFEYGTTAAYGTSIPAPAMDIGSGEGDQAIVAELSGLQAGTTYHYRVVAVNGRGIASGPDEIFTTVPPARIDSVSASDLVIDSATLNAQINPLGNDTTYHFEWGTDLAYGHSLPVPDADAGSGEGDVPVSQRLTGLEPNTTYHYRVAATNMLGTTRSSDHTFVYDTSGGGLPDNRAYEMVTPPQKNGALIGNVFVGVPPDLSEDGSRVIMTSIQCFARAASCTADRQTEGEQYAFSRTSSGWATTPLAPPATQFSSSSGWRVNAEAGTALFGIQTPPGEEDDFYARRPDGSFVDIGPSSPPSEGALGPRGADSGYGMATTADLSHVLYEGRPGLWPFDVSSYPLSDTSEYEYVGTGNAQPMLVGVSGGPGSTDLISRCGTRLGGTLNDYNALSSDGRTVYFTARACSSGSGASEKTEVPANEIYARVDGERPDAHTVAISQRSPGDCTSTCTNSPPSDASFQGVSADGSKVFFTSAQRLTDNATQGSGNLYLYDFARPEGHNLIAVSAGDTSGEGPQVQGVTAISPDGSHVYFVASGVLSSAANGEGQTARDGANNLYVFEYDARHPEGHVAFITDLPPSDAERDWVGGAGHANVTPDGRFLVFTSHGALTPDDTRTDGAMQVFRYDAQGAELERISIGERGFNDNGNKPNGTVCGVNSCPDDANIVSVLAYRAGPARSDPTMSHDGSYVFFESQLA